MNKFTKLLSVFVIAGAVSTGVAALAGCGNANDEHKHNVTKHEAVAATCTEAGSIEYYTCDGADCAGKYYSDEACTIEITDIVIAATGHTEVYTDKGDGTHGITCENGDLTETVEAHVDADSNNACDKCGATIHVHAAVKHEAVAATCTEAGSNEYYTCDSAECAGKYYSDEACTTEVTLESLTIPATGHTEVYTDKGDGTHGITCEHGDLAETIEAHTDSDHDGKCDVCGAAVLGKYVAEVPATCSTEGVAAHYINGDGSDGKLYSDCNLTTEVTAEDLVIAKIAHTHTEYTADKTYATHTSACDVCGATVKGDCVDTTGDGKCDVCGGDVSFLTLTALPAGSYYNSDYDYDLTVAADGTVSFSPNGYTTENVSLSEFAINTTTGLPTATLSYEMYGSSYTKTVEITRAGCKVDGALMPLMPEIIVDDISYFEGVYVGEMTFPADSKGNVVKVTEFAIDEFGSIVYTQQTTDKDGNVTTVSSLIDGTYYAESIKYNDFAVGYKHFVAVEVDKSGMVYKIELTDKDGNVTGTFTLKEGTIDFTIPTLPVEDYTIYKDAAGTNSLVVLNYSEQATYTITLNGNDLLILSGDYTNGYLGYVRYYDSALSKTVEKNYLLKFNADNSIELLEADGTTSVATLALAEIEYPTVKVDGTVNNNAVVDPFNTNYAYYTIDKTGWYTITAGANDLTIYTEVNNHNVTWNTPSVTVKAGKSKAIQLTAGQYIAVSAYYATYEFTAAYSENEPEPDYASFTDGKYEIAAFDSQGEYYVKGTAASAGKYYVSVTSSEWDDRGAYFVIGGTQYGYTYSMSSFKWSQAAGGLVYEATLEAGAEVKVKVGCENAWVTLGKVTVYFETEEEYYNRLNGGSTGGEETTFDGFTEDQLGSYVYESNLGATVTITLNADDSLTYTVNYSGTDTVAETTFVSITDGSYVFQSADGSIITFTLGTDSITVLGSNLYLGGVFGTYTATKEGTSGGETESGLKVGDNTVEVTDGWNGTNYTFKATAAGTYTITFDATGDVGYDPGYGYTAFTSGDTIELAAGEEFTFICYMMDYGKTGSFTLTITKEGSGSGETEDGGLKVGDNTIEVTDGWNGTNYTFKATAAGTYTITFDATGDVGYDPGYGYTAFTSGDTIELAAGEEFTFICYMMDYGKTGSFTLTITKEGAEEGGTETPTTPVAVVGENTVQAGMAGYVEVTFNVPGTYTLSYDSDADNVMGIFVGTSMVANGGKFTVTDSVTIQVYANDNTTTSKFTITVAEAEEGGEETESGLKVGENTISEFDSVFWTATVTFTAPEAGTYTFDFADVYASSTSSTIDGTPLALDQYTGAATATLTLEANQTIEIVVEQNLAGDNVTITITKA